MRAPNLAALLNDAEANAAAFKRYIQAALGDTWKVFTTFDKDDLPDECVLLRYVNTGADGHQQTANFTNTGYREEDRFNGELEIAIMTYRPDDSPAFNPDIEKRHAEAVALLRAAMLYGVLQSTPNLDLGFYYLAAVTWQGFVNSTLAALAVDQTTCRWLLKTVINNDAWPVPA